MRVNVVHAGSVPAAAIGHKHRRFRRLMLFVCCRREFGDLKGSHLFAVNGITILGKTKEPAVIVDHAATRAGNALVAGDDETGRMLSPDGSWIVGGIKSQRVMFMRRGTGKHPPLAVAKKDGRIGVHSGNHVFDARPLIRERFRAIKAHGVRAQRMRSNPEPFFLTGQIPERDAAVLRRRRQRVAFG